MGVKKLISVVGMFVLVGVVFLGCGGDKNGDETAGAIERSKVSSGDFLAKDGLIEGTVEGDVLELLVMGSPFGYPMEEGREYRHENTIVRNTDTGEEKPIKRIYFDSRWLEERGLHQPIVIEMSQEQLEKVKDFLNDYITVRPQARRGLKPGGDGNPSNDIAIYVDGLKVQNNNYWYATISFIFSDRIHFWIGGHAGRCRGGHCWGCSAGDNPHYGNLAAFAAAIAIVGFAAFFRRRRTSL